MRFFKTIFLALFVLATVCFADEPLTLSLPKEQAELWSKATSATMALRYGDAFEISKQLRSRNEGAGCVLENVVRISVYDDKGDTASLIKAGTLLESCKTEGLWDALRRFEIGYVQGETGHSVKGAMTTRSAAKAFEESKELEARAFFAIYAYYIDKSFSWVPFKSDNRELYLATLDSAHYDKEDFTTGLKLAERGLKRAPNHPVMLQIKADMFYRLKRYGEAADIYEKSAADYLKRTGKSIRYWCSVLNLIRIYSDKGDKAKAEQWRKTLSDPKYGELKSWMPGSLVDDLKKRKLI